MQVGLTWPSPTTVMRLPRARPTQVCKCCTYSVLYSTCVLHTCYIVVVLTLSPTTTTLCLYYVLLQYQLLLLLLLYKRLYNTTTTGRKATESVLAAQRLRERAGAEDVQEPAQLQDSEVSTHTASLCVMHYTIAYCNIV